MAYSNQTASDLNDILSRFNTFLLANGWTTRIASDASEYNDPLFPSGFTGVRLHVEKDITTDIGVVTCYSNLRSCNNQKVIKKWRQNSTESAQLNAGEKWTGIACYGSRGYNSGLSWDFQPTGPLYETGLSTDIYEDSCAGVANLRKTGNISCHFFSGTHSAAIVMQGIDQYYFVSFGVTDLGIPFWCCSGGESAGVSTANYLKSKVGFHCRSVDNIGPIHHQGFYINGKDAFDDSATYIWRLCTASSFSTLYGASGKDPSGGIGYGNWADVDDNCLSQALIRLSPDPTTGNPLLAPMEAYTAINNHTGGSYVSDLILLGSIPDMALVNIKYLGDASSIDIDGVTWKVFSQVTPFGGDYSNQNSLYYGYAMRT